MLKTDDSYYSFDLSNATDRLPLSLQKDVIAKLVGNNDYAESWARIMTAHEFRAPNGQSISYEVGQPMGAYSSWATFSLTHHLLVRVAAVRSGLTPGWHNYCLLGDDIVITNSKVAENYLAIMKSLGVEISLSKTHVSSRMYEFAKRWYLDGEEVTGLQLKALLTPTKWWELAANLQKELDRWSIKSNDLGPGSIRALMFIKGMNPRDWHKIFTFWNLPRKEDGISLRIDKSMWLIERKFNSTLGCSRSTEFYRTFVLQTLAEVKTATLESGMKNAAHKLHGFNQIVRELVSSGMCDQQVLQGLPFFESVRELLLQLQESFDSLRRAYWDLDEDIVFGEIQVKAVDPVRVLSARGPRVIVATKATIVNKYSQWARDYQATRSHLLKEETPFVEVKE